MNLVDFLNTPIWGGIKWTGELERRLNDSKFLEAYGYKVYSQNDEDGIIFEIFNRIGTCNKTFVEFGVDKGIECNSHSLLLQGWKGLWIEGRESAYNQIARRFAPAIRRKDLTVINAYVTIDNINNMLAEFAKGEELDLISIDIDGNDYHIWNAISVVNPRVVVIEYQGKFPPEIDWVMAYNPNHVWDRSDRSGASLKALEKLGNRKGYQLVGTNICGVNAFFVRKDLTADLFPRPASAENLYNPVRSNIVGHMNGNPALNFVGQDIEGIEGVFEYYPDWNTLASFGFWKVEVLPHGRRNIMREKEAKMFLRWIPKNARKINVHISVDVPLIMLEEPLLLKMDIAGRENTCVITRQDQMIEIPINGEELENKIVPLDLFTNVLWIPSTLSNSSDERLRGIAIEDVSYK